MEFVGHRQRGRGAAAREQPDQALQAALQRPAARRQVVPLYRHPPATPMAAARQAPRRARQAGNEYFGPFASATAVNRTLYALQRAFLLRSCSDGVFVDAHPALPAVPDQALHRALRRPHRQAGIRRHRRRGARLPRRPQPRGPAGARRAHGEGRDRARFRAAPPCCATASARWPTSSRTSRSACRRSTRPTSSPPMPTAASSASRSSSSAPARTRQPRLFPEPRQGPRRRPPCWPPSSASSTRRRRRRSSS